MDAPLCECGCGQPVSEHRGRWRRFVVGHATRGVGQKATYWDVDSETGCWTWNGALTAKGYGKRCMDGGFRLAHVARWEEANGPVPEGLELDHLCRNKACVNLAHLEPVTHAVNVQRGSKVKLNPEKVAVVRRLLAEGQSASAIGRRFGVSHVAILRIKNGKGWVGVGV